MTGRLTEFLRDRSGAGAVEFSIVALVLVGTMLAIFDMSRVFYEYNQSVKACQEGVRFAVVNYLVAPDLATYTASCPSGDPIPQSVINTDITTNPVVCTCSSISGSPATCGSVSCNDFAGAAGDRQIAFNGIARKMAAIFPRLVSDADATIQIAYEVIPGGLCNNPAGPDILALTTVSIGGLQFEFATPLVGSLTEIEFPRCRATLTSEDLSTCGTGEPPYTDVTVAGC